MKVIRLILLHCRIFLFAIGIAIIFVPLASAYDLKKYYPLDQGNSWTYSVTEDGEITEETIRIKGKEVIAGVESVKIIYPDGDYECMAIDSQGMKMYKALDGGESKVFKPALLIFPNIKVGESKKYSSSAKGYHRTATLTGEITLESIEDVNVPAGKFQRCLRFSCFKESVTDAGYDRDECTIWLAPGVGKIKEISSSVEYDANANETEVSTEASELISGVY